MCGSELLELDSAVLSGLFRLRGGMLNLVDAEKMRLRGDRHAAFGPVANLSLSVEEARDHFKHLNEELAEKKDSYDRAVEGYEQSRAVMAAFDREDADHAPTPEQIAEKKTMLKMCEALTNSCYKSVQIARKCVATCEFQLKNQGMVVLKVSKELEAAEALHRKKCENIDSEMDEFHAVDVFITHLTA